ncbi:MAG: hypothetical protein KDE47_18885, partial [Caldilineaceae bacterium]|nr:hypothetical protein [Caldilineaceae bacterium]
LLSLRSTEYTKAKAMALADAHYFIYSIHLRNTRGEATQRAYSQPTRADAWAVDTHYAATV